MVQVPNGKTKQEINYDKELHEMTISKANITVATKKKTNNQ